MKQLKSKKKVWLTRDDGPWTGYVEVHLGRNPKNFEDPSVYWGGACILELCVNDLKKITGFYLEPGECVRAEISIEVVK